MCPEEDPIPHAEPARRPIVLVVEDEVLLRMGVCDHLRDQGFVVVEAASADEAQSIILAGVDFNIVFSDVNMPGELDGVGLALWLQEEGVGAPIILTSGLAHVLDDARARCPHVSDFVVKPYPYDWLGRRLRALLEED